MIVIVQLRSDDNEVRFTHNYGILNLKINFFLVFSVRIIEIIANNNFKEMKEVEEN